MTAHPLAPLLAPASIAIVGASEDPATVGHALLSNVQNAYTGKVYAVNPNRRTVLGTRSYRSVGELPHPVDLALIATPAKFIVQVVEDCAVHGVPAVAIITSELTDQTPDGSAALQALVDIANRFRIRILGPNSIGVMRPESGLNATFASSGARSGTVALVAQSGAMVSAVLDWAEADEIGFSSVVSLGNKLDVDFADVLDFLTLDSATESIVLYVEGVRNARKFMSALRAAARVKPVIVLKAGRDAVGSRAAATHTRSLSGRDDVFDAALQRAGAVRVRTFVQLFSAAKCLSSRYRPTGNRLAIITNGGGPGVMASDRAAEVGIEVTELSQSTVAALDRVLPESWSHANPVDLLEDADVSRYREAVATCLDDPNADGLLVILAPQSMTEPDAVARSLVDLTRNHNKHVFACWMGDRRVSQARTLLARAHIPVFRTPEPAVEAFSTVASFYQNQRLLMQVPGPLAHRDPPNIDAARSLIESALASGRTTLLPPEAGALLQAFRIPTVTTLFARDAAQAAVVAKQIGFPVAMKICSPDIAHKQQAGGVRLNLGDASQIGYAYDELIAAVTRNVPQARVYGVAIQPMVTKPNARDLLGGLFTDEVFGPIVAFGAGGTDVELIADQAVALPPLNAFLAGGLIARTRIGRRLGESTADGVIAAAAGILLRISEIACELPWVREMDLNPLIADSTGAVAVDAHVVIGETSAGYARDRYAHMAVYPYPTHLTHYATLADGAVISIRAIRPEDAKIEREFVHSLSDESKYFRFISALHDLSERMLVRFTQIDYDREMALVAVVENSGGETQIGVARYAINSDGESCEFAVAVADGWQARGVGSRLMRSLMEAAKQKGLHSIEGYVLHNNEKMLKLMHRLGFAIFTSPDDPSLKHVTKRLTDE